MKIVRKTDTELVVQDSSIWMAVVTAVCSLLPLYIATFHNDRRAFAPAAVLLLFAVPWLRRTTFTFDAARQTIRFVRLRYLRTRTGSIPFAEVKAVDIQTSSGPQGNVTIYRLALATSQGTVPMSDVYSSGESRCTVVRDSILCFLKLDASVAATSVAGGLDISIRALLQQGRKIDAIQLLRSAEKLSLAVATQRVNAIDASMKPAIL